jgi:hypothetical protein
MGGARQEGGSARLDHGIANRSAAIMRCASEKHKMKNVMTHS